MRIGILTSGGDAPGMNPAIRAVTVRALREGYRVLGIRRGWGGLVAIDNVDALTALGFWLWNRGAARTSAGPLAAANNLKVPLAVLVAWLVFAESAPYLRAAVGLLVVVAGLALATGRDRQQDRDPGR